MLIPFAVVKDRLLHSGEAVVVPSILDQNIAWYVEPPPLPPTHAPTPAYLSQHYIPASRQPPTGHSA